MQQILRRIIVCLLAVCAVVQIGTHDRLRASASGIVISQVYGGGGATTGSPSFNSDYVELLNTTSTAVTLTGYSLQYGSATGTGNWVRSNLPTITIQPGHYFLVQQSGGSLGAPLPTADATGSLSMSASSGKIALVSSQTTLSGACPTTNVVDVVGYGSANCSETSPAGILSSTTAAIRKNGGLTDTDNNSADFSIGTPTPRNAACTVTDGCPLTTNPVISAPPISVLQGDPVLLKVTIAPGANPPSTGITVKGDLTSIGGNNPQQFYDDGTNGDVTAGDLVFSYAAPAISAPGTFSIPMTASDAQGRSATPVALQLTVAPLTAIHDIQGTGTVSPFNGQKVTTRGIVTGVKYNGFFIQAAETEYDADPSTSEGVFVYTGSTLPPAAVVGNRVQVTATVSEFKSTAGDPDGLSMTELTNPTVTLLSTGNALPSAVTLTPSDLSPGGSIYALEKYEGMRVHVDTLISISPTDGTVNEPAATSTSSGVFYAVLPGVARPFREVGLETPLPVPSDAQPGTNPPVFDANPERIAVDSFSVFLDPATAAIYPPPPGTTLEVTSGVTVTNVTGPLDYAYRSYMIDAEGWNMPAAATANASIRPVRPRNSDEFTVATMNLERFYDTIDDPNSDTVLTPDAFNLRLSKASAAILTVMQAPDIIGVEEMEKIEVLQALADRISSDSNGAVQYAPYLMEGNDIGGIDVGLLARKDKVTVGTVEQLGKDTLFNEPGGSTSLLNDRPSLIVHASILNTPYDTYPVTIVVNHLKAMTGLDGEAGARNRAKRLAQSVQLAGKLQDLQVAGDAIISVGDYNALPVNDGYTDVIGIIRGAEAPAGQVTLWAPSPVTPPLFEILDLAPAAERYSYVFDGNAQEIDHILYTVNVQANGVGYARMNADFPESMRGSSSTPARLSDHDPVVGYFSLPDIDKTAPSLTLPDPITIEGNALGGAIVTFTATAYDAVDGNVTPTCSADSGSLFSVGTTTVKCSAVDAHGNRADGSFTVTVTDTKPPVINGVTPSTATLWPPSHAMIPVSIVVADVDIVDPAPRCQVTSVTATDDAAPVDWAITGPLAVSLRSERSGGSKDGRVYTIEVVCTDASGNTSTPATTTVTVPHDQRN